ncbi:gamma-glutamyltransferase family protein [Roseitranquillus sediminis]|uniref:gamma-glutamyltransferase family protein n=1 Tax=Roseitranquillus sediminis TaxID=2809051 RepID=UPI001D0C7853|nr:gamma-glutamyltransferase family protein [Roseitranquillus sediminis]MBM9595457.1 gamma-glutamyltransferase family protein [Roseitranquillus sediminis]
MNAVSPTRARIIGTRHMVAAGHYLAAQAGFQMLEAGGNATDAGVAAGLALCVVQSEYVSFGGVAPIMIHDAASGRTTTISGLGTWPARTDPELFLREYGGRIPRGVLRSIVPGAPDAWITALELHGTMSFSDAAAPALGFARDGFPVPELMARILADYGDELTQFPGTAAIWHPGGAAPKTGDIFVQSDLAETFSILIEAERRAAGDRSAGLAAARDAFYRGEIAQRIAAHQRHEGGWLDEGDLAGFRVDVEAALSTSFGAAEVFMCAPWCQGPVLGQTLAMLDGDNLAALGHNTPAYVHRLVEALKLSYADRHALYGDPTFVDVPTETLLSASYARARAGRIDPHRAHPGMPDPGLASNWGLGTDREPEKRDPGELDTSYVCVVDRQGNVFSATPSDGPAGGPVVPGLGFVVSGRGVQSFTDPAAPARVGPGRRPRLTPSPALFRHRDGDWIMPIGSPGNDVQPQAILQAFLNMEVFGMTPQEAVEAPRFATFSYPRSSVPHPFLAGLLRLEERIGVETREALRALGHDARDWPDWDFAAGGVCTIRRERNGRMEGGADPRRPGAVAGW